MEILSRGGVKLKDGRPNNVFATLSHHPELMDRWIQLGNHVLSGSTLSRRERELMILRVGVRCRSRYEFSQHALIAKRAGIADEEIESIRSNPDSIPWSVHEGALIRAVDELHDDSTISDETWALLAASFNDQQMLDVVFTIAAYHMISYALNSCRVELDEGIEDVL
jgi:alkylhydroperoxidase family enzyme